MMLTLHFPKGEHEDVLIDKDKILVGASSANDLILNEGGLEDEHAEIWKEGNTVVLVNRGGCEVNDQVVDERCRLLPGDRLTIGAVNILVKEAVEESIDDEFGKTSKFHLANDGWYLQGLSESVKGRVFAVEGKVVIGRDPACGIAINDPEVSRQHAELEPRGNRVTLKDLGSTNGTRVNGQLVTHAILKAGDKFSLDLTSFCLQGGDDENQTLIRADAPATQIPKPDSTIPKPRLVVRSGDSVGHVYPLSKSTYSIGRTADNDIVLDDSSISRVHARLIKVGNGWALEDLGSTNGTSVNGTDITQMALQNGDRVRMGRIKLVLEEDVALPQKGFDSDATMNRELKTESKKWAMPIIWRWVLAGLLILCVGFALWWFISRDQEKPQITSRLQISKVWNRELGEQFQQPLTPAIGDINDDGFLDIVIASAEGYLVALDGEEGKKIFEVELAGQIVAPPTIGDVNSDGTPDLVVGTYNGLVYALDGNGKTLWETAVDKNYGGILNRPVIVDLQGDNLVSVLVATAAMGLVALKGERGWEVWNSESLGLSNIVTVPTVADLDGNGTLDIAAIDRDGLVVGLRVDEGRLWKVWEQKLASFHQASTVIAGSGDNRYLVAVSESDGIFAHYGKSGLIAWQTKLAGTVHTSPLRINTDRGGALIVVNTQGQVSALSGETGRLLWQYSLGNKVSSSPALADLNGDLNEELLVVDEAGVLSVLDNASGRLLFNEKLLEQKKNGASLVLADVNNDSLIDIICVTDTGEVRAIGLNRRVPAGGTIWPQFLGS